MQIESVSYPVSESARQVTELAQTSTQRVIASVGIIAAVAFIGAAASWPEHYQWNLVPGMLIIVLTSVIAYQLLARAFIASQVIWQFGLSAAVLTLAAIFQQPEMLFLLALLPLMAVVALGVGGGFASEAGVIASMLFAARSPFFPPLGEGYPWAIILGGGLCGLLGWASTSSLVTVMGWFVYSYKNLQTNLEEIRQQRTQLNRALRQLDQANQMLQRANASLVAARRAAEEAERFKAEFVANVSHELRTPLNLIIGFAQVMVTSPESYGGEPLPGGYRSDIYAIYNSAKHLRALVDDVLDMGRLDANKIALVRQPVPVAALVNEIETMVRDYVTAKGLELRAYLDPDLPILQIDQLRIRQVLLNLLVNAVRFTEKGIIQLQVSRQDQQVMFRVQDTGRGIAPEDLPHIFEPFHTTNHHAETPWHTGTGLGIPISKKFVELHGGQMGVESGLYEGTTFWFTLPCETCGEPNIQWIKPRAAPPDAEEMERIVVVVTPDDGVTSTLQRQIANFRFVTAENLAAGAAMAHEFQATALIADETPDNLPTMDIPIVNVPLPTREKIAAALGARDLLTKPVSAEQLIAALDRSGRTAPRVLIADQDPGLARLFRRILRPRVANQNLLEAYTSDEILTRLAADRPDMILLSVDLQQPSVRQMLAQPEYRDVWVILIGEEWDEWMRVLQPLQIFRSSGFRSGELMRTLQAILGSFGSMGAAAA